MEPVITWITAQEVSCANIHAWMEGMNGINRLIKHNGHDMMMMR